MMVRLEPLPSKTTFFSIERPLPPLPTPANPHAFSTPRSFMALVQVYEALLEYKSQHGNLQVPVSFRVPECPPWREDSWGLALGQRCAVMRWGWG